MCTGLEFVLALPAVFAPTGFPFTLFCCHAAVKPTICDMLLSHENFGTDTLLPTPLSKSHEKSLGSLMHTLLVLCLLCVPCAHSLSTHSPTSEFAGCCQTLTVANTKQHVYIPCVHFGFTIQQQVLRMF